MGAFYPSGVEDCHRAGNRLVVSTAITAVYQPPNGIRPMTGGVSAVSETAIPL